MTDQIEMPSVFPFTLYADRQRGWSSHDFRDIFLSRKPQEMTWYGYDTIVHSRTEVEFVIYDMADMVYGGLGKEKHRFRARVDRKVTKSFVEQAIFNAASEWYHADKEAAERKLIEDYAEQIRGSLERVK